MGTGTSRVAHFRGLLTRAFLASVAVNAVLGIWALLASDFGDLQANILATSFLVSGAMLSILINGVPYARRAQWAVPVIAAGALVVGFVGLLVPVWSHVDADWWFRLIGSAFLVGVAGTLCGYLALLTLRPAHRPLRFAAFAVVIALVLVIGTVIWTERGSDGVGRVIGVLAVALAALSLALPVLSRFWPAQPDIDDSLFRYCPACGESLGVAAAAGVTARCGGCRRSFAVYEPGDDQAMPAPPGTR